MYFLVYVYKFIIEKVAARYNNDSSFATFFISKTKQKKRLFSNRGKGWLLSMRDEKHQESAKQSHRNFWCLSDNDSNPYPPNTIHVPDSIEKVLVFFFKNRQQQKRYDDVNYIIFFNIFSLIITKEH